MKRMVIKAEHKFSKEVIEEPNILDIGRAAAISTHDFTDQIYAMTISEDDLIGAVLKRTEEVLKELFLNKSLRELGILKVSDLR